MNAFVKGETHPVHDLVGLRWSPRKFSDESVDPELVSSLLEAARWAPSSFNEQPWRFIVARREDTARYARILGCLSDKNQEWAGSAAALLLTAAQMTFGRTGKPNRHALYDVGQAVAQLTLQATASGLGVHQIAGFDADKAREEFAVPAGTELVTAMALGYARDPLERTLRKRRRHPQSVLSFGDTWGDPLDL